MADYKFDRVIENRPINDDTMRKAWIYDGKDETKFTSFTGRNINASTKNLFTNMVYTNKVLQIVKSCVGILEGNYQKYIPDRKCCDNLKYCPHKNDANFDKVKNTQSCPYLAGEAVIFDNVFYISLIDINNEPFEDKNSWYEFNYNITDLDSIVLADTYYDNKYRLTVNHGVIELEKISGTNKPRVEDYSNDTIDEETPLSEKCESIRSADELTKSFKYEMDEIKNKYDKALKDITEKYDEEFIKITNGS